MTPATLFLAAVGFAVIVGGALLLVVIVEWRVKRRLRKLASPAPLGPVGDSLVSIAESIGGLAEALQADQREMRLGWERQQRPRKGSAADG